MVHLLSILNILQYFHQNRRYYYTKMLVFCQFFHNNCKSEWELLVQTVFLAGVPTTVIFCPMHKMLHLLQQIFSTTHFPQNKRALYVSLIRSKLMYNSPLWHPQLIKDITVIELVQWRATKYILSGYSSSYKARLITLKLLPLMMHFELNDILFFVNCLKNPMNAFNIYENVTFSSHTTRCTSALKLKRSITKTNSECHSYFNRLPHLWNSLPVIDLSLSFPPLKRN